MTSTFSTSPFSSAGRRTAGASSHFRWCLEESGDRQTKRGDVPHAGLRRADDGNALADAETRSGAFSASESEESRRENSVSVVIGADPATALAGMLPIPPDLDEMMFAGFCGASR